jgi:hypothetical protein
MSPPSPCSRADSLPPQAEPVVIRVCEGFVGVGGVVTQHNNRDELADTIARELKRNHLEHFGHL